MSSAIAAAAAEEPAAPSPNVDRVRAWVWMVAGVLLIASLAFPLTSDPAGTPLIMLAALRVLVGGLAFAVGATRRIEGGRLWLMLAMICADAVGLLYTVHVPAIAGLAGGGFWTAVVGLWLAAWMANDALAALEPKRPVLRRLLAVAVPANVRFVVDSDISHDAAGNTIDR